VKVTSVSVQQLFDRIEFALAPQAAAKGLRLRLRSGALWVKSDVALLQRMVLNLAYNALRYSDKGTILITCRGAPHGTQARLQVWDSGIGIAPEHQANIFKEFFQVDNPNRVRTSGMGLGLNIVQRSAQLLGINVAVRSALGCGTRFTLTLPLVDAPETPRAASPVTATATELHGVRVMVVEDDQIISQALSELLQSWGCVVQLACSAAQAIEIARIEPMPTILLSDYRLGEAQNGLYAIAALRELAGYKIAACLMSGDTDAGLMQAAKDADLILLHKPVRPAKLRTLLRRFVAAQEQGSAENR
jgi:CheY-like chemotaxis protein